MVGPLIQRRNAMSFGPCAWVVSGSAAAVMAAVTPPARAGFADALPAFGRNSIPFPAGRISCRRTTADLFPCSRCKVLPV